MEKDQVWMQSSKETYDRVDTNEIEKVEKVVFFT